MEKKQKILMKEDGTIEITEEDLERDFQPVINGERNSATSYWKSDGSGHFDQYVAYFNIVKPQQVNVTTRLQGKLSVTINFYNVSSNHAGPSLPQKGGLAGLDTGYWKCYFTGWITSYPTPSGIWATVNYR